jgi:signal recognition particle subunit SRP19
VRELKQSGKIVVWTVELDSAKSRSQRRRLPKSQAVQAPRIDELELAAKKLSFDPEISPNSALPSCWWEKTGYVMIKREDRSRSKILKDLAAEILKIRQVKK